MTTVPAAAAGAGGTSGRNHTGYHQMRLPGFAASLLLSLLLTPAAAGGELRFGVAPDDSAWSSSGDRLSCHLSQRIPRFGSARFTSKAGGGFSLSFQLEREPARKRRQARLLAVPPPWRHKTGKVEIAKVTLSTGSTPVTFGRDAALRTLYELEKGMSPRLTFRDWADARDRIVVTLSAVNLLPALRRFQECTAALHPVGFSEVRELEILFDRDSHHLTDKGRAALDRLASYLEVDRSIRHVILNGYTTKSGNRIYNQELVQLRLDRVQEYLMERGVPGELLVAMQREGKKSRRIRIRLQR